MLKCDVSIIKTFNYCSQEKQSTSWCYLLKLWLLLLISPPSSMQLMGMALYSNTQEKKYMYVVRLISEGCRIVQITKHYTQENRSIWTKHRCGNELGKNNYWTTQTNPVSTSIFKRISYWQIMDMFYMCKIFVPRSTNCEIKLCASRNPFLELK